VERSDLDEPEETEVDSLRRKTAELS